MRQERVAGAATAAAIVGDCAQLSQGRHRGGLLRAGQRPPLLIVLALVALAAGRAAAHRQAAKPLQRFRGYRCKRRLGCRAAPCRRSGLLLLLLLSAGLRPLQQVATELALLGRRQARKRWREARYRVAAGIKNAGGKGVRMGSLARMCARAERDSASGEASGAGGRRAAAPPEVVCVGILVSKYSQQILLHLVIHLIAQVGKEMGQLLPRAGALLHRLPAGLVLSRRSSR